MFVFAELSLDVTALTKEVVHDSHHTCGAPPRSTLSSLLGKSFIFLAVTATLPAKHLVGRRPNCSSRPHLVNRIKLSNLSTTTTKKLIKLKCVIPSTMDRGWPDGSEEDFVVLLSPDGLSCFRPVSLTWNPRSALICATVRPADCLHACHR